MDEALEEHHVVHGLLGELKKMKPSDERYDAKIYRVGRERSTSHQGRRDGNVFEG